MNLAGMGEPGDDCGKPVIVSGSGSMIVQVPHRCTLRSCPLCVDGGYANDQARKILKDFQATIFNLARHQKLKNKRSGRMLHLYRWQYSPGEDVGARTPKDLSNIRRNMNARLKRHGFQMSRPVLHPYRGDHGPDDPGPIIRMAMNQDLESIHFHGFALGYWSKPSKKKQGYVLKIETISQFDSEVDLERAWAIMMKRTMYDLNHCGWIGDRGQSVTRLGGIDLEDQDYRPDPDTFILDPETGEILDLNTDKIPKGVHEFASQVIDHCIKHQEDAPRGGIRHMNLDVRWYHLDEVIVTDDHRGKEWDTWLKEMLPNLDPDKS